MQSPSARQMLRLFGTRRLVLPTPLEKTRDVSPGRPPTRHVSRHDGLEAILATANAVLV